MTTLDIEDLFRSLKLQGGSDLHLAAGLAPRLRLHGSLEVVRGWAPLEEETLLAMLRTLVDDEQWRTFCDSGDLDFAHGVEGVGRFRGNFLRQENGAAAVLRLIPEEVLTVEDLGLPPAIAGLADLERGLVLITGPTGSGKSTTLAALIDRINRTYEKHIVTIEDPIEFVHRDRRCVFSQREVGPDTTSFASALRAAIRQDADVVLVGEMRDLETTSLAITAAEMGLLVFGTLHTNDAVKTLDRLIDVFPAEEQAQIRTTLAESVSGIVAQQLMPTADGRGRCAAFEILLRTPGLANVIRDGNTPMLTSIIQGGKGQGMQTMDDSLAALVEAGTLDPKVAYGRASDKSRFDALIRKRDARA